MEKFWLKYFVFYTSVHITFPHGILYPQESESRELISLDGIWKFQTTPPEDQDYGFNNKWFSSDFTEWSPMPVPASYNDITVNSTIRDFLGWVWYQRTFYVPKRWLKDQQLVWLRFGSVHFTAVVWVNGKLACEHSGGHLPFQADITNKTIYGVANHVTVAVNNTLSANTIPQGFVEHTNNTKRYPPGYVLFHHYFDFFNYAGIHRPVYLYTTPQIYIDDITVVTDIDGDIGIIKYIVEYEGLTINAPLDCTVVVYTQEGTKLTSSKGLNGKIHIQKANFWWPYLARAKSGYRYTLEVHLHYENGEDIYRLPVGIRKITWNATTFLINNVPTYLAGFGKHEDADVRGKGLDYPILIRDYSLITWLGANSYRTSHYPYAEETLDIADSLGIMIINESPACSIDFFTNELLQNHKRVITEMIRRDKNRPSVVMWSLANEPKTFKNESSPYFSTLVNLTRLLDSTRPITFVTSQSPANDKAVQFVDIVCVNRYSAWYQDSGLTDLIQLQVKSELLEWHNKFNKPVLMTEYGAGSITGMHMLPSTMWTEDYHVILLKEHFKTFDLLRKDYGFLIGEMIWNFADFATPQEYIRPGGCMKGLFTRNRQPKLAAHIVRWRYWKLAQELVNVTLPNDLLFEPI